MRTEVRLQVQHCSPAIVDVIYEVPVAIRGLLYLGM